MRFSANARVAGCLVLAFAVLRTPATNAEPDPVSGAEAAATPSAEGYRLGAFRFLPEIGVSMLHDSNIYATRTDEVDDAILLVNPSLQLLSDWRRHKLNLTAGATAARYTDTDTENYQDYWADTEGRYDFSEHANFFGGLGFTHDHEDRSSPDDTSAGEKPTRFDSNRAHAGFARQWDRWSVRVGATVEALDYRDQDALNNDDRDRDLFGFGVRVNRRLNPRTLVHVQAIRDVRAYEKPVDDNGFDRDSRGGRYTLGFSRVFSNRLNGGASVGVIDQHYDDPAFTDLTGVDFDGTLSFRATPATRLTASVERTLEETTLAGASGYLLTSASLEAERRIDPRLRATAGVTRSRADYRGIAREDDLYSAEIGLRYMLSARTYLAATYRVSTRDSSLRETVLNDANRQETDDFSRQQIVLTLGTLLYPGGTALGTAGELPALPALPANWGGLYFGGGLALGATGLHGRGVRGGSGRDEADYADDGVGGALFAGFGRDFGRWYLGLEADADDVTTDLHHAKDKPESRTLDIARGRSYGWGVRGGYRLTGGDLLYLRLGRARTDFDTDYTINNAPENAVDRTFTRDGTRYGIGADIPAARHLFVRMEYAYTDYENLRADLGTEVESFAPSEGYFRLGLGWQLDALAWPEDFQQTPDAHGFYAGAQIGHGSLNSDLTGTHFDGGTGPFDFTGNFGHSAGATGGAFAGWGENLGRWYAGLEATAEAGTVDWVHERENEARNFSVDKSDAYGLGARVGYQLANGTLVYIRGDRMHARFNTRWRKGANRDNDVDRDDRVEGMRLGVGAELPISRSLFARLDYSYTQYDDYAFTTAHASADSMQFDNSETLFRAGVGARF